MSKMICILLFLCLAGTVPAYSQPFWSVGGRLGHTFGEHGGFTWGLEASYFPMNGDHPYIYGYTADLTFWHEHVSLHAGLEGWLYMGLDLGPTLFFSKGQTNLGMSIVPWDGAFLYPYYELGIPFNGELFHSIGVYIKQPVGRDFNFSSDE